MMDRTDSIRPVSCLLTPMNRTIAIRTSTTDSKSTSSKSCPSATRPVLVTDVLTGNESFDRTSETPSATHMDET
jgi:hypothetical protein